MKEDDSPTDTFKCNENVVKVPWDIETVHIIATKHFGKKYMHRWGWDYPAIREAIRTAYTIQKTGKNKYDIYINKGGYKKIICVDYDYENQIVCITGSQGDTRI